MLLRPYQIEALQSIDDHLKQGIKRQMLTLPTGAGKTVVFCEVVKKVIENGGRAMILAHRDRLIEQAHTKLTDVLPGVKVGIIKAERNEMQSPVMVASMQTICRPKRLNQIGKLDLLIIDEAHRSAADNYRKIIDGIVGPDTFLLGVTATPNRTDGIALQRDADNPDGVYDKIVYQVGILDLIKDGYLAPLRGQQIVLETDFSDLKSRRNADGISDYNAGDVAKLMEASNWHEHVARGWLKYAANRRTIAFVPRVAMAYQLVEHLQGHGVRAAALDGSRSLLEQKRAIRDFEAGQIQFLANCDLFVEGADIPSIDCVLFARPTKSKIIYSQAVGRGTRLFPGKTDCLVLDVVGASNRMDLCTLGTLAGIKKVNDGENILDAVERDEVDSQAAKDAAVGQKGHLNGEVIAKDVSLFGGKVAETKEKPSTFSWDIDRELKVSTLRVHGNASFQIWKGDDNYYYYKQIGTTFSGSTLNYKEAEAKIEEKAKELVFGGRDAKWRQTPATPKQIELLNRMRIRYNPGITSGQASEMIDQFKRRRRQL
jgi:superfamily II DNA or RNA helicase